MINKKIKTYSMSPVDGEALLNYKGRLAADDFYMQVYDIDKSNGELVNVKKGKELDGLIFNGDCLSTCAFLKDNNILVDLVYIDPPFASGANYSKKLHLRNKSKEKNLNEKCDDSIGEEIMYGDIWKKEDYLNWIYTRLLAIKEVMSDHASIYVHLDYHIAHYVKVMLDEIFGEDKFRNEIIWCYTGGTDSSKTFNKKHDNIFFYTKSDNYVFNGVYEDYAEGTLKRFNKVDENGKRYKENTLADGRVTRTYMKEEGKLLPDYWYINIVVSTHSESADYNTQKPEELLRRIITASTEPGMTVADFFGGSGVTSKVAYNLGRKFITSDIGENAVQTIRDRLKEENASFEIIDIKDGLDLFRNPTQTILQLFNLCSGEKRTSSSSYSNLWDGLMPYNKKMVYTKIVDNRKIVDEKYIDYLITEISEDYVNDEQDEYLVLYVFKDETVDEQFIEKKLEENGLGFKMHLISIESILKERRNQINIPDSANIKIEKKEGKYEVVIDKYFSPYLKKKIDDENLKRVNKSAEKIKISENGYEFIELVSIDTELKEKWISSIEEKAEISDQIKGKYLLDTNKFRIKIRNIAGDELIISSEELVNE